MTERLTCPRCGGAQVRRYGIRKGYQRWRCGACRRIWNDAWGTPLFHLHTPLAEIVRTILVVLRRGSLRAAEEVTGHSYEAIGGWIRRIGAHADAATEVLVRDLKLSEVEVDEFWGFVGRKGGTGADRPRRRG